MATEVILMACVKVRWGWVLASRRWCVGYTHMLMPFSCPLPVKAGGDRQDLHEAIRVHSMDAGAVVKAQGKPNDLLERIAADSRFAAVS